jgi:hypothetical protein
MDNDRSRTSHHRNYWPGLLRSRSAILGQGFSRKPRCSAVSLEKLIKIGAKVVSHGG